MSYTTQIPEVLEEFKGNLYKMKRVKLENTARLILLGFKYKKV